MRHRLAHEPALPGQPRLGRDLEGPQPASSASASSTTSARRSSTPTSPASSGARASATRTTPAALGMTALQASLAGDGLSDLAFAQSVFNASLLVPLTPDVAMRFLVRYEIRADPRLALRRRARQPDADQQLAVPRRGARGLSHHGGRRHVPRAGCRERPDGMNWIASSIRNKILAVFVLGIALVVAGALYGFAAARSGPRHGRPRERHADRPGDRGAGARGHVQGAGPAVDERAGARPRPGGARQELEAVHVPRARGEARRARSCANRSELPPRATCSTSSSPRTRRWATSYRAALETFKASGFDAKQGRRAGEGHRRGAARSTSRSW